MDLTQVKRELTELGKTPASEKLYPITSEWVPLPDVMAIINRFEQHWRQQSKKDENMARMMNEILGQA